MSEPAAKRGAGVLLNTPAVAVNAIEAGLDTRGIAQKPPLSHKIRGLLGAGRLTSANFTDYLADVYGDRTVFLLDRPLDTSYFKGDVISYADLNRLVKRAAGALTSLGIKRGDRVGLCTANRIELAFVEFAAQRIGAIAVPINFMLTKDEMAGLVRTSGARIMVVDRSVFQQTIVGSRSTAPSLADLKATFGSVDRWVMVTAKDPPQGIHRLDDLMAAETAETPPADVGSSDPAMIFFTAGTTGLPKGATLTSGALMHAFRRYARLALVRPTPRTSLALLVMPLAHIGGHQALLIQMALACPSLVMGTFDPDKILDYIERYRVSMFAGIPTMFRMLLAAGAKSRNLSSIRLWGGGGDAFPAELVETFRDLSRGTLGRRAAFVTGYGLAETAGQMTINPFGLGQGSVGWFLPGIRARLVDEHGSDVKSGEIGELIVKTPSLMNGYWEDRTATEKALDGGWFRTGDLMKKGPLGQYLFVAREKDMIKVGGYSVFPAEVEAILDSHPDIEQSVVVGLPHAVKGSLPVAAVVRQSGSTTSEEALLAWARDHVARYRCPRRIVFVDEIPLNQAMKPLRRQIRADLVAQGIEVESFAEQNNTSAPRGGIAREREEESFE
jgi:acyl-CoA synthetase (AMP-forming)/AMP-acid ligase II